MGDRTNPIKFGPEWMRNLSREPSTSGGPGREGTNPGNPAATSPGTAGPPALHRPANASSNTNTANTSKVLLAKLRYGREEMLALYDRQTAEAPVQLKSIDTLYQPRGKPPYALNNIFEDEARDSMRAQTAIGGLSPGDRYPSAGRGRASILPGAVESRGRTLSAVDNRGRPKVYNRQTSVGRGSPNWHGNARNSYSGMPDDDPNQAQRAWNNNNPVLTGLRPPNVEQPDWQNKQQRYKSKRLVSSNWRQQQNRDEGEEWRATDGGRRPQEKWEWDWQEGRGRLNPENKSWHSNRRTWVGGENNEEPLPEWAMDNAEACGGTFDSSGAFLGYSNDDSNILKTPETAYPLTRSHTHGSFARSKPIEEGTEEWWASEKAKKLSPKRFDASEIKFKKPLGYGNGDKNATAISLSEAMSSSNGNDHSTGAITKNSYHNTGGDNASKNGKFSTKTKSEGSPENKADATVIESTKQKQVEDTSKEKKVDSQQNSKEKANKDKGNFQSVILTQNNSLRQKHQNIVVTPTETPKRQPNQNILQFFDNSNSARQLESDDEKNQKETENNKLVEDILHMSLEDSIPSATMALTTHSSSAVNSLAQQSNPSMQIRMASPLDALGLNTQNKHNMQPSTDMQPSRLQSNIMQPISMTNSMLNASLGLPLPTGLPLQRMPPLLPNSGLSNMSMLGSNLQAMAGGNLQSSGLQAGGMQASALQSGQSSLQGHPVAGLQGNGMHVGGLQGNMQGVGMSNNGLQSGVIGMPEFQSVPSGIPAMSNNSSLFNNIQNLNISNHGEQNMFPMHGIQPPSSQSFNNSVFGNMVNRPHALPNMGMHQPVDQWFYEDPNKTIQGPFTSNEMFNWFRAGFFSPSLMVRRACEATMRPLGTYGHMPFGQMDLLPPFPLGGGYDLQPQQSHDNLMQPNLGIDVESLWGQPANNASGPDQMWMQVLNNNPRNENLINDLPMYFWENQPSAMPRNPLLMENMKTEDEILAQMRANQAPKTASPLSFLEPPATSPESGFTASDPALDMEHLQKLIQDEDVPPADVDDAEEQKQEPIKSDPPTDAATAKPQIKAAEVKLAKDVIKSDSNGKTAKTKDVPTKPKNKNKTKEEKREESVENIIKEEEVKTKERSAEPSPSKSKKEDKSNKKDLEKEKKEWIKEGFTIVKSTEKSKDNKKKAEEAKAAEEADRKRKEEEKLLAEEKKRQSETIKKQQEIQIPPQTTHQRQVAESVTKKAPWSASSPGLQATSRDGPTLAEIQRLEREKKLEQIKEQQQMMQIIAQQQAVALAREQEMQAGLGWAKKKPVATTQSQTLTEIQAEARKQAAAAAAAAAASAAAAAREEALATPPLVNTLPWGNTHNGGAGFWDTLPAELSKPSPKQAEVSKPAEPKAKKKVTVTMPPKKDNTPSVEFDTWCNNILSSWRDCAIDIPTFVSFLREIESPYEVKDYVKCYLGESRETSDFARQFLERRSRMLRVGMVTPSDDLCSPAVAVNPRTNSGSDYTEVKGKAKKIKKNKMFKVDARNILGFSVTASEDRINVGDIDSV